MIDMDLEATQEGTGDGSIAAVIAQALAARIVSGELKPGVALRQDHVAAEFHASHVPVREAFRRLEAQSLVVSLPRRGVRVAPLDPATVLEAAEMRAVLEQLALRHSLSCIRPLDLDEAEAALDADAAATDVLALEAANRRFHRALTWPCAMPRLCGTIADLQQSNARALAAMWQTLPDWQSRSAGEHRAILDAIRRGEGEQAAVILAAHIRDGGKALAERLAAVFDATPRRWKG